MKGLLLCEFRLGANSGAKWNRQVLSGVHGPQSPKLEMLVHGGHLLGRWSAMNLLCPMHTDFVCFVTDHTTSVDVCAKRTCRVERSMFNV